MTTNLLKVVYFDEGSAIDYLDIFNGGVKTTTSSKEHTLGTEVGGTVDTNVKTGILFKAIKPFMDLSFSGGGEASFSRLGESAVKATIANTVLSDFIKLADADPKIEKSIDFKISAFQESITFLKMYTPYFNMVEYQKDSINFQKIDETLEKGKGYYELIGEDKNNYKIILRFNIKAFRNNYNLVDLTRMNLMFYSVKVGKMKIESLDVNKEFEFKKKEKILTGQEIIDDLKENNDENDLVDVFDVILAGIKSHA